MGRDYLDLIYATCHLAFRYVQGNILLLRGSNCFKDSLVLEIPTKILGTETNLTFVWAELVQKISSIRSFN